MKTFITNHPTLTAHLISAAQTFVTGFAIGIFALGPIDWSTFGESTIFALFLAGCRAGVKLVYENLLLPYFQKSAVTVDTSAQE